MKISSLILTFSLVLACMSCDDKKITIATNPGQGAQTGTSSLKTPFSRMGLLKNWVNNIITPAYLDFKKQLTVLKKAENNFVNTSSEENLVLLQKALLETQKKWQHVAMFEFGKAEELKYRTYMNSYPLDFKTSKDNSEEDDDTIKTNLDEKNLKIDEINFKIEDRADEQGLPAVDYLINGQGTSNEGIIDFYTTNSRSANYKKYLTKVVDRMVNLTNEVVIDWQKNADSIILKTEASDTGSFEKLINDYLNYFEQGFREAKIATPSGKRDGVKFIRAVESFYSSKNSKILFLESYKALKNFYEGNAYSDNSKRGHSIKSYLEFLNQTVWDEDSRRQLNIIELVDEKYKAIDKSVTLLNEDFTEQIKTDNSKMKDTFNALQSYVILTKLNIFQLLNVTVDFVDGDGD